MICTRSKERKNNKNKLAKASLMLVYYSKSHNKDVYKNHNMMITSNPSFTLQQQVCCSLHLLWWLRKTHYLSSMATLCRSSNQHFNKRFHLLMVFNLVLLMQRVGAMVFKVGSSKGWSVPPSDDSRGLTYNQWAEMNRFQVGDSLLFVYQPDVDLVMQVNQEDYKNCYTATPIATYSDGNTTFTFDKSGPHYFISGIRENCLKNEKLDVVVMAERNNHTSDSNQTTIVPPPSPSGSIEIVPAPIGEESPSPPTSSTGIIPSSAPPGEESPPLNGATSSKLVGLIGSVAAFLGSSLLLDL